MKRYVSKEHSQVQAPCLPQGILVTAFKIRQSDKSHGAKLNKFNAESVDVSTTKRTRRKSVTIPACSMCAGATNQTVQAHRHIY